MCTSQAAEGESGMATATTQDTVAPPRGIEVRSIDWVPEDERHGKIWHQAPLWFLGNFQYFSIPIGFVGPSLGLSLGWSILAGVLGIWVGTVFMAFHAAQSPALGLSADDPVAGAVRLPRGRRAAVRDVHGPAR